MNAIQISGGVDSLAMLYYLRPVWDDSVVMWCDTGAAYAETREQMVKIKERVPRFKTVYTDQAEVIRRAGFPADVVPVKQSLQGEFVFGPQPLKFQSYVDCCRQSIWEPMHRACLTMGVDTIYRGQRRDDVRRSPITSGGRDGLGTQIVYPVYEWSRDEVFAYARKHCADLLPAYYDTEATSRDCWNCTAYRDDNVTRVKNLPADRRALVEARLEAWRDCLREELQPDGGL